MYDVANDGDVLHRHKKWWSIIQATTDDARYKRRIAASKRAREWFKNTEQLTPREQNIWDGDVVRANLWQKDILSIYFSLMAEDPLFDVACSLEDPIYQNAAVAYQNMAKKIWTISGIMREARTAALAGLFDNLAYIKLEWDRFNQFPTLRWCEGKVIVDLRANGMFNRAGWVAELVERPFIEVYYDRRLPEEGRKALLDKFTQGRKTINLNEKITMAYIWSKQGATPWQTDAVSDRKLIVMALPLDEPMAILDWPWPFLRPDQFPIYQLRIIDIPGEQEAIPLFEMWEPLLRHYNWAASFMMASGKKEATKKVLYNERVFPTGLTELTNGKHMSLVPVDGNVTEDNIRVIDFGGGNEVLLKQAEFAKQQHDEQSGITDLVRGMSPGGRQTAEEIRTLSRNSSLMFQGIGVQLDAWFNEMVADFIAAIIYYIPAFSWRIGPGGDHVIEMVRDPQSGTYVPQEISPDSYASLPAWQGMPEGSVVRPGVDAWLGIDAAMAWLDYDIDQLRRDFGFSIEAGSSRAEHMMEEQRNALAMLQTLGPVFLQFRCMAQYYELVKRFIMSFRPRDPQRLLPPMQLFMAQPNFVPQPPGPQQQTPLQQPPAQTLGGMSFGAQGLQVAGQPEMNKRSDDGGVTPLYGTDMGLGQTYQQYGA